MFGTKYDYKYKNAIPDSYYGTPADIEYLRLNRDVAAAVADNTADPTSAGAFTSGYAHYVIYGKAEGRTYPFGFVENIAARYTAEQAAAQQRLAQVNADAASTAAERAAAYAAATNAERAVVSITYIDPVVQPYVAPYVAPIVQPSGVPYIAPQVTDSSMTPIYIVGAIAVIGILALIFKKKKSWQ